MVTESSKKLIYFTASFPYGLGETWKSNELKYLVEYFKEITVVPYCYGGNFTSPKLLPRGVRVEEPLFESDDIAVNVRSLLQLVDRHFFYYLNELCRKRVLFSKRKIVSWLKTSIQIKRLWHHPVILNIMKHPEKDIVLYFFWGRGSCEFLPFVNKSKFGKIAVRFHRYDLFEDQNEGYIPYRKQLLKSVSLAAPSSESGYRHLRSLYPKLDTEIQVIRMGVVGEGETKGSTDNILRIISCSYVVPVKRVHLIAEAMSHLSIPIEWIHIGDGPLMNEIRRIVENLPVNIKINFPGMISAAEVISFYKARPVDLFLNVSSSEGVPFSIMEALSAGIPVFATDVGGTGEIIDDSVGRILHPDITPQELAFCLEAFYKEIPEKKSVMRRSAIQRYQDKCNAEILTRKFATMLIQ